MSSFLSLLIFSKRGDKPFKQRIVCFGIVHDLPIFLLVNQRVGWSHERTSYHQIIHSARLGSPVRQNQAHEGYDILYKTGGLEIKDTLRKYQQENEGCQGHTLVRKPLELLKQCVKAGASKRTLQNMCSWYWIPGGTIREMVQKCRLQEQETPWSRQLKITIYGLLTLPNSVVILGNPARIRTVTNSVGHIATAVQRPDRRMSVPWPEHVSGSVGVP